jgi:hypothetical protein
MGINNGYVIQYAKSPPEPKGLWFRGIWEEVPVLGLTYFHPEGSGHSPKTSCKLLYDAANFYAIFQVEDRYVRCVHTGFQADVYKDSCVELFLQPDVGSGYFNFEFNCGGALLASYVTDPTRINGRVSAYTPLTLDDDARIQRFHSLPEIVEPEIADQTVWYLECAIPFTVMEKYAGPLGDVSGRTWRGNVYKCGNETSHPHWGAWSPIHERNFHLPECFGTIQFEKGMAEQSFTDSSHNHSEIIANA